MPQTMTLEGKRATAAVFASNLILEGNKVILLIAYGPSQEVRAFAQLLNGGDARLEVPEITRQHNVKCFGAMRMIQRLDNGYSALYAAPFGTDYVIGDTEEECFGIYSRILDQSHFVHAAWYREIFNLARELPATIGTKKCYRPKENIKHEVKQFIAYGGFKFPAPTAELEIEVEKKADGQQAPEDSYDSEDLAQEEIQ